KKEIIQIAQFREGQLPVTYLDLPLVTKRLSKSDYNPLVERITTRANSWISKSLSLAGRLQLVKATLVSMQTYCDTFPLPISTIKECERVPRSFLWGGMGRSKVKWADVCKPQEEGGLGIKDLRQSNFWALTKGGLLSWTWKQLLLLRPMVKEHFYICGNGESFSLCYDPWLHVESVHALYGHRVIYDTGLRKLARVRDILSGGGWSWPQTSADLIDLQQRVQLIPISTEPDSIYWDKAGVSFTTDKAWQALRHRSNEFTWHCVVWHSHRIPKHAFILWLALRGALRTRDILLTSGVTQSASCVFNCGGIESSTHLFFHCPYTANI
ncbi:LOW QUALITY PROTEIN: zf-RVT domain-containing protein, partial [Cephalotus follicularis]